MTERFNPDDTFSMPSVAGTEAISIDELADGALAALAGLGSRYESCAKECAAVKARLLGGEIRIAIMGQFKRGKSSFVNSLVQIDLLPTSVIPLTSVPTLIRYDAEPSCTIRFLVKKPDMVVHESLSSMRETLVAHVSEQRNPKNRLSVREAVVTCPSPILRNGTILIDTPGFGSTFVHNTKTTVDLIRGCDAVLFLLSADPPFTQTEVEFLREVRRHVPRIFFIVNKTDQLSAAERATLDPFLTGILISELGYEPDVQLFHVSARLGTGMDIVKSEIFDFLAREKFFTLSQAVSGRFRSALSDAAAQLEADAREREEPISLAKKQYDWLRSHCDTVKRKGERELALVDAETKALVDFAEKTLEAKRHDLFAKTESRVRELIGAALDTGADPYAAVSSAFVPLAQEMISHLSLQIATAVSRPLQKAIELPYAAFFKTLSEVRSAVASLPVTEADFAALSSDVTIEPFYSTLSTAQAISLSTHRGTAFEGWHNKAERARRCESRLLPLGNAMLNEQFELLSRQVKNSIRALCDTCRSNVATAFSDLIGSMHNAIDGLEAASQESTEPAEKEIASLRKRKEAIETILANLL